jgi:anti-anti-sigma regulatory factor
MLKITKSRESSIDVCLVLEGKIVEQWAALLDGVCRSHLREHKTVHLDCERVDFIDANGVDVLNNLPRPQVTVVHAPGFITQQLQNADPS